MSAVLRSVAITADRFKQAEYVRNSFRIVPQQGQTLQDIIQPGYWAHIAQFLKVGDHIEVFAEDQSYWAELLVVAAERTAASVQVLNQVEIQANSLPEAPAPGYRVEWKGPQHRWSVIRIADGQYIKEGFDTKQAAGSSLQEYLRALAI
jgi:hypothetical protein